MAESNTLSFKIVNWLLASISKLLPVAYRLLLYGQSEVKAESVDADIKVVQVVPLYCCNWDGEELFELFELPAASFRLEPATTRLLLYIVIAVIAVGAPAMAVKLTGLLLLVL